MAPKKKTIATISSPMAFFRNLYLYLVCGITIVMVIIASVQIVRIGLDVYVFNVDRPAYWYNECMDPKPTVDGTVTERTEEEQVACEERAVKKAVEQLAQERKRDVSQALAMLLVTIPLYLYHWGVIKKDHASKK